MEMVILPFILANLFALSIGYLYQHKREMHPRTNMSHWVSISRMESTMIRMIFPWKMPFGKIEFFSSSIELESLLYLRINGQVYTIDSRVTITQTSESWQISSVDTNLKINLTVQPKGNYAEKENLIIVVIDFVQSYGIFQGTIEISGRSYVIENSVGIVENHYAKW